MATLSISVEMELEGDGADADVARQRMAEVEQAIHCEGLEFDESLVVDYASLLGDLLQLVNRARARRVE